MKKTRIKKMIAFILTMTMVMQSFVTAFAATEIEDTKDTKDTIRETLLETIYSKESTKADVVFDEDYKIKSITDVLGNTESYQYNNNGYDVIQNGKLSYTAVADDDGRVLEYLDLNNGLVFEYSYDGDGSLTRVKGDGYDYQVAFDEGGSPTQLSVNNNLLYRVFTNGDDAIITKSFGNNQKINYKYDEYGALTSIETNTEPLFDFVYDGEGFLKSVENYQTNSTIDYSYVDSDVISTYDDGTKITDEYSDIETILSRIIDSQNGNYEFTFSYDSEDYLSGVSTPEADFQYAEASMEYSKNVKSNEGEGTLRERFKPDYDRNGVLTGFDFTSNNNTYYCNVNSDGAITGIELDGTPLYSFEYENNFGQLIGYTDYIHDLTYTFTYDNAGNILSKSCVNAETGEISEVTYEYNNLNWVDQLTDYDGVRIRYDSMGNMTDFGNQSYTWTQGNKLSEYSNSSVDAKYYYDENGVRIKKEVNGKETTYIADGYQVLLESVDGHEIVYVYLYDKLLGFYFDGEIYYYKTDALGDIVGIYDQYFNQVVSYEYDIWGNILDISGEEADTVGKYNPYRYRGYRYDEESKLYYLYSRYYNPEIGRFISADCQIGLPGSHALSNNLYAYCMNNPVMNVDPYGYFPVAIGFGGVIVIGAFVAAALSTPEIYRLADDVADVLEELLEDIGRGARGVLEAFSQEIGRIGTNANQKTYQHPTNNHHIIAQSALKALPARTIYLNHWPGEINHSRNIVTIKTSFHVGLHTDIYYRTVNDIIDYANSNGGKSGVASALSCLKVALRKVSNMCP